jgi:hypothetical protein
VRGLEVTQSNSQRSGYTVLVCGSRDWMDADAIYDRLDALDATREGTLPTIIHGAARGADSIAAAAAESLGYPAQSYPADWKTHGKRAGILRNLEMLDQRPELVLAFQRDGSRGTQHTIDEARRRGIPVEVHA